jgi:hypothetical protein
MKKGRNKILLSLIIALSLGFVSCLTDSDYENGINGILPGDNDFVEIHLTSANNTNTVSRSYDAMDVDTTINWIPVHLTAPTDVDVTVDFVVLDTASNAKLKSYVLDDGYKVPAATQITIMNANNKVVIPKGSTTGYIQVKFKPVDFVGDTWAFGVQLTAVTGGAFKLSNLTTGFIKFGIKNKYDGQYTVTGVMKDNVNAGLTDAYPENVYLITQDGTSVAFFDVDVWGDYFHAIKNGASYSGYGSYAPIFKFDANNNVISVTNIYGQPAGNGRKAELDATGVNKWDPATKTLKVKYWMIQNGVYRTSFDETFTYVGPR